MVTAPSILPEADRRRVEAAIEEAERRTSAEFVVIVARRSGRYDRSEDVVGLVLGLAFLVVASILQTSPVVSGSWESPLGASVGLPAAVALVAAGYVVGAVLATRFPRLARPFRTRGEMLDEVRRRAADCFTDFRLRDAQGTGILVYVSLLERLVWITADDTLAPKLPAGVLEAVRDEVVAGLRRGSLADGLVAGVVRGADGVAAAAPPAEAPAGRVPNTLREI